MYQAFSRNYVVGTRVRLKVLQVSDVPEFQGYEGCVVGRDERRGVYKVRLDPTKKRTVEKELDDNGNAKIVTTTEELGELLVGLEEWHLIVDKLENQFATGMRVMVINMENVPAINLQEGVIRQYDHERQQWIIEIEKSGKAWGL